LKAAALKRGAIDRDAAAGGERPGGEAHRTGEGGAVGEGIAAVDDERAAGAGHIERAAGGPATGERKLATGDADRACVVERRAEPRATGAGTIQGPVVRENERAAERIVDAVAVGRGVE